MGWSFFYKIKLLILCYFLKPALWGPWMVQLVMRPTFDVDFNHDLRVLKLGPMLGFMMNVELALGTLSVHPSLTRYAGLVSLPKKERRV